LNQYDGGAAADQSDFLFRCYPDPENAAAATKVVKRFVMPRPLAVLIDQAASLASRCAHSYGASGTLSRYRIKPVATPSYAQMCWPL
jgi:hypothetical protein